MQRHGIIAKVGLGVAVLSVALALAMLPAAAKQLVVTASTDAHLAVGQIIEGNATLSLPVGAKVTLIGEDGKALVLQGPYSGSPGQGTGGGDPSLVSKLAKLLDTREADASAIGAVRGSGATHPTPSQAWVVDIAASGTICVRAGSAVLLWRADGATAMHMTLRRASADGTASVEWAPGSVTMPWPANLPVVDGEKYLIRRPNRSLPNVVQLRELPADLPTDAHRAVWMSENGCTEQAQRLLTAGP